MRSLPLPAIGMAAALLFSVALAATPSNARKDYEAAIKSMRMAEEQLNKAGDDPSGHKTQALEHLRQAIGQADAVRANVGSKNP